MLQSYQNGQFWPKIEEIFIKKNLAISISKWFANITWTEHFTFYEATMANF